MHAKIIAQLRDRACQSRKPRGLKTANQNGRRSAHALLCGLIELLRCVTAGNSLTKLRILTKESRVSRTGKSTLVFYRLIAWSTLQRTPTPAIRTGDVCLQLLATPVEWKRTLHFMTFSVGESDEKFAPRTEFNKVPGFGFSSLWKWIFTEIRRISPIFRSQHLRSRTLLVNSEIMRTNLLLWWELVELTSLIHS